MTETSTQTAPVPTSSPSRDGGRYPDEGRRTGSSGLVTEQGRTTIADTVVAKIAGIAAREVNGVHSLGGGAARAVGSLRERIPGGRTNHAQGLEVSEVNIDVRDVHLEGDDDQQEDGPARVQ